MTTDDSQHFGILLEEIRDEIKSVHELVADQPTRGEFNELRNDVIGLKEDIQTVKHALADTSRTTTREIIRLDTRIDRLEAA